MNNNDQLIKSTLYTYVSLGVNITLQIIPAERISEVVPFRVSLHLSRSIPIQQSHTYPHHQIRLFLHNNTPPLPLILALWNEVMGSDQEALHTP